MRAELLVAGFADATVTARSRFTMRRLRSGMRTGLLYDASFSNYRCGAQRILGLFQTFAFRHPEHGHLTALSSGKVVFPHASQTNRPCGRTVMGRNLSSTTQ